MKKLKAHFPHAIEFGERFTGWDRFYLLVILSFLVALPTIACLFESFFQYRRPILGLVFIGMILVAITYRFPKLELGLHRVTLRYAPAYVVVTLLGLNGILLTAYFSGNFDHFKILEVIPLWKLALFSVVTSSIQQIVFKILIIILRNAFKSVFLCVFLNALIFSLIHFGFGNHEVILPLMFCGGVLFSVMYILAPNLILITGMHWVFNFSVFLVGLLKYWVLKFLY